MWEFLLAVIFCKYTLVIKRTKQKLQKSYRVDYLVLLLKKLFMLLYVIQRAISSELTPKCVSYIFIYMIHTLELYILINFVCILF